MCGHHGGGLARRATAYSRAKAREAGFDSGPGAGGGSDDGAHDAADGAHDGPDGWATLEGTLAALAKPENAERLADFTKNYYDALVRRGFTKDQALQIVTAVGIPHASSTGR